MILDGIDWSILIWLIVAALSGFGEVLTGTLFLIPFAIAALVAAVLVAFDVEITWVLLVFGCVTLGVLAWVMRFGARVNSEPPATREGSSRYTDARGSVTRDIEPMAAGRVRLGAEDWRALSEDGESIPSGTRVRVLGIRGNALIVEPLSD